MRCAAARTGGSGAPAASDVAGEGRGGAPGLASLDGVVSSGAVLAEAARRGAVQGPLGRLAMLLSDCNMRAGATRESEAEGLLGKNRRRRGGALGAFRPLMSPLLPVPGRGRPALPASAPVPALEPAGGMCVNRSTSPAA